MNDIQELIKLCFNEDFPGCQNSLTWDENSISIGHVGWDERYIDIDNKLINITAIQWVCTHPEYRNKGVATDLLRAVNFLVDTPYVMLFTGVPSLYEQFGFKHYNNLPDTCYVQYRNGNYWDTSWSVNVGRPW